MTIPPENHLEPKIQTACAHRCICLLQFCWQQTSIVLRRTLFDEFFSNIPCLGDFFAKAPVASVIHNKQDRLYLFKIYYSISKNSVFAISGYYFTYENVMIWK